MRKIVMILLFAALLFGCGPLETEHSYSPAVERVHADQMISNGTDPFVARAYIHNRYEQKRSELKR